MDGPLWTEQYRPQIEDIQQQKARRLLFRATEEPVNLILQGPIGSGKTAAARAVAREVHDDVENDLIALNVSDFFNRTKKEIR
ncbi:MAG: AAA family ATPase, partial [Halobacteriaceae archaeon]